MRRNQFVNPHKRLTLERRAGRRRHGDHTRQCVRHFDARKTFAPARTLNNHRQIQAHVGNVRKRARRVVRQRRQHGKHCAFKIFARIFLLLGVEFGVIENVNARAFEQRHQIKQNCARGIHQAHCIVAHQFQLVGRCQTVHRAFDETGGNLLLEPRNARHEKFRENGTHNRQKLDAFQQRIAFVLRLFQHAPKKCQQREFTIHVQFCVLRFGCNFRTVEKMFLFVFRHSLLSLQDKRIIYEKLSARIAPKRARALILRVCVF